MLSQEAGCFANFFALFKKNLLFTCMYTFTIQIINSVCDDKLRSEVILFIW